MHHGLQHTAVNVQKCTDMTFSRLNFIHLHDVWKAHNFICADLLTPVHYVCQAVLAAAMCAFLRAGFAIVMYSIAIAKQAV
jgi:cbb3-type cytochrome oxidase subunit 1